jgi:hypothetical protein
LCIAVAGFDVRIAPCLAEIVVKVRIPFTHLSNEKFSGSSMIAQKVLGGQVQRSEKGTLDSLPTEHLLTMA